METEIAILIVDDSPTDTELVLHALKKHNFDNQIKILEDGQQALDYLFNEETQQEIMSFLHVVFLDLKMPKVSGIEVLEAIRKNKRTKYLPVVILTSSNEDPDLKRCYELGCNSYVVKPIGFDKFSKVVADLGFYWRIINKTISSDGEKQ